MTYTVMKTENVQVNRTNLLGFTWMSEHAAVIPDITSASKNNQNDKVTKNKKINDSVQCHFIIMLLKSMITGRENRSDPSPASVPLISCTESWMMALGLRQGCTLVWRLAPLCYTAGLNVSAGWNFLPVFLRYMVAVTWIYQLRHRTSSACFPHMHVFRDR